MTNLFGKFNKYIQSDLFSMVPSKNLIAFIADVNLYYKTDRIQAQLYRKLAVNELFSRKSSKEDLKCQLAVLKKYPQLFLADFIRDSMCSNLSLERQLLSESSRYLSTVHRITLLKAYQFSVQIDESKIIYDLNTPQSDFFTELKLITPRQQIINEFILELKNKSHLSVTQWIESLVQFIRDIPILFNSSSTSSEELASSLIKLIEPEQLTRIIEHWANTVENMPAEVDYPILIKENTFIIILIQLSTTMDEEQSQTLVAALLNKIMAIDKEAWISRQSRYIKDGIKRLNTTQAKYWVTLLLAIIHDKTLHEHVAYYDKKLIVILDAMIRVIPLLDLDTAQSFSRPLLIRLKELHLNNNLTDSSSRALSLIGAIAHLEPGSLQSMIQCLMQRFNLNELTLRNHFCSLSIFITGEDEVSQLVEFYLAKLQLISPDQGFAPIRDLLHILCFLFEKLNKTDTQRVANILINIMNQYPAQLFHLMYHLSVLAQKPIEISVQSLLPGLTGGLQNTTGLDRVLLLTDFVKLFPSIKNLQEYDNAIQLLITVLKAPDLFNEGLFKELVSSLVTITTQLTKQHPATFEIAATLKTLLKRKDHAIREIACSGLQNLLFTQGIAFEYDLPGTAEEVVLHKMQEIYHELQPNINLQQALT